VTFPFPVASVEQVNLLERRPEPLELVEDEVRLSLRPWEIATLRIKMAS
jgi:alpha-mannosidase